MGLSRVVYEDGSIAIGKVICEALPMVQLPEEDWVEDFQTGRSGTITLLTNWDYAVAGRIIPPGCKKTSEGYYLGPRPGTRLKRIEITKELPHYAKLKATFGPLEYGDQGTAAMKNLIAKRSQWSFTPQRYEITLPSVVGTPMVGGPPYYSAYEVWRVFKVRQYAISWTNTLTDYYNVAGVKGPDSPDSIRSASGFYRMFVGATTTNTPEGKTVISRWDDIPVSGFTVMEQTQVGGLYSTLASAQAAAGI